MLHRKINTKNNGNHQKNNSFPLKGNYDPKLYKIYFKDTGLLIASLDEEAQEDLRANKNLGTYKGAIYENIVGDMMVKQGYDLYYYHSDKPALEMDFFVRDAGSLIPVEVKATDGATASHTSSLSFSRGSLQKETNKPWKSQHY